MSLVAHYPFQGDANDVVGSNDGQITNVTFAPGIFDRAASFDGSSTYITIPDFYTGSELSVALWVKFNDVVANWLVSKRDNNEGDSYWQIHLPKADRDHNLGVSLNAGSQWIAEPKVRFEMQTDRWYHLAFTTKGKQGDTVSLYVDGVIVAQDTLTGDMKVGSREVVVGAAAWNKSSHYHDGLIQDLRIYDHELTLAEMRHLARGLYLSLPLRSNANEQHFGVQTAVNGGVTFDGDAAYFDGVDDYIGVDSNINAAQAVPTIAIDAWVRIDSGETGGWAILDYDRSENFNATFSDGSSNNADGGFPQFGTTDSSAGVHDLHSATDITGTGWRHVAWVYDGKDKVIYIDGVEDCRSVNPHNGNPLGTGPVQYALIGDGSEATQFNGSNNASFFHGRIRDLRQWFLPHHGHFLMTLDQKLSHEYWNKAWVGERRVRYAMIGNQLSFQAENHRYSDMRRVAANADGSGGVSVGALVRWAEDISGNNNHMSVPSGGNPPKIGSTGNGETGVFLNDPNGDGSELLRAEPSATLDFSGPNSITVEGWFRSPTAQRWSAWSNISCYDHFLLGNDSNTSGDEIKFIIFDGNQWIPSDYGNVSYNTDDVDITQWHHYAGVYDYALGRLYLLVDGVERVRFDVGQVSIASGDGGVEIGHRERGGIGVDHEAMYAQQVRVWRRALSPSEIAEVMNRRILITQNKLMAHWPL